MSYHGFTRGGDGFCYPKRRALKSQVRRVSLLRWRLRIGYPQTPQMVDELENLGVVSPPQGGRRERDVLIGAGYKIPGSPQDDPHEEEEG